MVEQAENIPDMTMNNSPIAKTQSNAVLCDIECVGDEHDRNKGLENPFEENPGFKISKVVVVNYQLNQLITGYEC